MLILCTAALTLTVGAVSLSDGKWALCDQFKDGEISGSMDYVWYSPVKGESDNTEYPLVVWLHGRSSGSEKRKQLNSYDFSNWSSEEYQARFKDAGGAFLLLPRANSADNNWYLTEVEPLKKLIDIFIEENKKNIDLDRIYIAGYSSGGTMVYNTAAAYPDFFAAMIPICGVYTPTTVELDKWKDLSVWFVACTQDPYVSANAATVKTSFNYLSSVTNRKDGVRMTTSTNAVWADGTQSTGSWKHQHYVMDIVIYDMHMKDGSVFAYTSTSDGNGNEISFENDEGGVISWLSQQRRPSHSQTSTFIQKIIDFFKSIFRYIGAIFSR